MTSPRAVLPPTEKRTSLGPLLTTELVDPGRYTVSVPRVVADLSTGLRPRG